MFLVLPDDQRCTLSERAFERWHENVCPLHETWWALSLLQHVTEIAGELTAEMPSWIGTPARPEFTYLILGDFALILSPARGSHNPVAVTCIARGGIPAATRAHRNRERARARAMRAGRRHDQHDRRSGARAARRAGRAPSFDDQA